MLKSKLLIFCLTILILSACKRERDAGFTLEKNEVYLGENVRVSPDYRNVDQYEWDLGDGKKPVDEEHPGDFHYTREGTYTITLTASHKRNMKKSIVDSKQVKVVSWTVDSITLVSIPDMMNWDSGSGPDMIFKIDDPTLQFENVFTSDFFIDFPDNLDTTDLPFTLRDVNARFFYSQWKFRLLEEDLPLPNVEMLSAEFNPYIEGSNGSFAINGGNYDIRFYYHVNE